MSKCYRKRGDKGKDQNETRKQTNSLTRGAPSKWNKSRTKGPERRLHLVRQRDTESRSYKHRFPRWLGGKESACQAGNMGLIPGSGRSPGEGNGYPLQYACLTNPTGREAWQADSPWGHRVGHNWATKSTNTTAVNREGRVTGHDIEKTVVGIGSKRPQERVQFYSEGKEKQPCV